MKSIIGGFRYDTAKAIEIGSGSRGYYPGDGDFSSWDATLYVTPRARRYFLAGAGGPMTRFARRCDGNSYCGGEAIIPMSKAEAMEWAEAHLTTTEIEAHFGAEIEDA